MADALLESNSQGIFKKALERSAFALAVLPGGGKTALPDSAIKAPAFEARINLALRQRYYDAASSGKIFAFPQLPRKKPYKPSFWSLSGTNVAFVGAGALATF